MSSDSGPSFVRQFALTQGRVRSEGADLQLDALVESTEAGRSALATLGPEQKRIIELAGETVSLAELGAHVGVHLGIARVLVGDLVAAGHVVVSEMISLDDGPDLHTLERLLDDLRSA